MGRKADASWVSVYIYPPPEGIASLPSLLEPWSRLVSGGDWRSFFIRYADSRGGHIRIRVRGESAREKDRIISALNDTFGVPRKGWTVRGVRLASGAWFRAVPYFPEVKRYGGRDRLPISEGMFAASSDWVYRHFASAGSTYSSRMLLAGVCMLVILRRGMPGRQACLKFLDFGVAYRIRQYSQSEADAQSRRERLQELWSQEGTGWRKAFDFEKNINLGIAGPLQDWAGIADACLNQLSASYPVNSPQVWSAKQRIIGSWCHMHNNRLGIEPHDETVIIHSLLKYVTEQASW